MTVHNRRKLRYHRPFCHSCPGASFTVQVGDQWHERSQIMNGKASPGLEPSLGDNGSELNADNPCRALIVGTITDEQHIISIGAFSSHDLAQSLLLRDRRSV